MDGNQNTQAAAQTEENPKFTDAEVGLKHEDSTMAEETAGTLGKATNEHAAAPPSASGSSSAPALQLPPELWLNIFELLDYHSLKALMRVCKELFWLLQRPEGISRTAIDKILFRDSPLEWGKDRSKVIHTLHPILYSGFETSEEFPGRLMGMGARNSSWRSEIENLFIFSMSPSGEGNNVWQENAYSPAYTSPVFLISESWDWASDDSRGTVFLFSRLGFPHMVMDVMVLRLLAVHRVNTLAMGEEVLPEDDEEHDRSEALPEAVSWLLSRADAELKVLKKWDARGLATRIEMLRSKLSKYRAYLWKGHYWLERKAT